jgi:hypothetical protein
MPNWYPTRLLQISDMTVKLIVTGDHDLQGSYATLSHFWGDSTPKIKLTQSTFESLSVGVDIGVFESTYRDALIAARALGIRYLWIDLFCIY